MMDVQSSQIGQQVIEGKTKKVYKLVNTKEPNLVYILSKDRITAGDGAKSHEMQGKARISTQTNCAIFEYLNAVGIRTHFVSRLSPTSPNAETAFVAKECAMIPIEWVCRRVATGSFLKRHPHVKEGHRFAPPKLETFFKDDANHDPFWSYETLVSAGLEVDGLIIEEPHVKEMFTITQMVFEVLERAWQQVNHALIDMKIEFGVIRDENIPGGKRIVVADVIDNDSWRLWPGGDKRLMLDKQIYRNMDASKIDDKAIEGVKSKFEIVAQRTQELFGSLTKSLVTVGRRGSVSGEASTTGEGNKCGPTVAIMIGSTSDMEYATKIKKTLATQFGIENSAIMACSAHKSTSYCLENVAKLAQWPHTQVIIACAGRSNGLGPVTAANCAIPVINSPPTSDLTALQADVWSSLRLPSGMGCPTIFGAENAALAAAQIVANTCPLVWSKIRTKQAYTTVKMIYDNEAIQNQ